MKKLKKHKTKQTKTKVIVSSAPPIKIEPISPPEINVLNTKTIDSPALPIKPQPVSSQEIRVPNISISGPLKIEEQENTHVESSSEKSDKVIFILGSILAAIIVMSTLAIWYFYFQTQKFT